MAVIGNISIRMAGDANPFVRELGRSIEALEQFESAAKRTQQAADSLRFQGPKMEAADTKSSSKGFEETSSSAVTEAATIKAAFTAAMAPLGRLAVTMASQFEQVGGTIVTLARRIDSSMKFPALMKVFDLIEERFATAFSKGAVNAVRKVAQVQHVLSSLGDVAGRKLSNLFNFNLGRPVAQVAQLNVGFRGTLNVVNRLKFSVASLGTEIAAAFGGFMLVFKGVQFLKDSAREASNLNETINKTGLIFADQAGTVGKAADEMASRFGVVKTTFLDTADQFGQLLQGMGGQTREAAATTSIQLAKLVGDASSTFNESFSGATAAIASALRGQSEPISRWGIDVQESAVKAEALRMGLIKVGQEMTTQQKVAARTAIVIRGLGVAEGDLARTGDQPANAMRRFVGNMKNAGASLMSFFLPAIQKGLALLNQFATWLNSTMERNRASINAFAEGVGQAIDTAGMYLSHLPEVWEIVKLKVHEGVLNLIEVFKAIPVNLRIIGEWVMDEWPSILFSGAVLAVKLIAKAFMALPGLLLTAMKTVGSVLISAFTKLISFIGDVISRGLIGALKVAFTGGKFNLPALIGPGIHDFSKQIDAQLAKIHEKAPGAGGKGGGGIGAPTVRLNPTPVDTAALEAQKKLGEDAARIFEQTRTPAEKYNEQLRTLNEMLKKGAIDQETYRRAAQKAADEFGEKGKRVFEETRTPLEKFQAKLKDLKQLLTTGQITRDTFDRAAKMAGEDLTEANKKGAGEGPKFAGAFQLGSSDAYSALLQFRGAGNRDDGIKDVAQTGKKQLDVQNKILTALTKPGGAAGQPMQVMAF